MIDETYDAQESRFLVPALASVYAGFAPAVYAAIRVLTGLMFLPGGVSKLFYGEVGRIATGNISAMGFPAPVAWAWAVAVLEFFGAILLILGLFTRPVAFALTVELFVIAFGIMIKRGAFWSTGGIEVALLMGAITFSYVLGGGGRYSLDRLIGREF
jgi:putative oxidoreductase